MPDCCVPGDLDDIFSPDQARADARAYRRDGLDGEARRIVDAVRARTRPGYTVLEVGGGVGAIQLALLREGAASAMNVELSHSYEPFARELIHEAELDGRVVRRVADFVAEAATVPAADVVIMQRVVCCYPYAGRLVATAAAHAGRLLVLTFPIDRWPLRLLMPLANAWLRVRGSKFRIFAHRTSAVIAAAREAGLALELRRTGFFWQMLVLVRPA
jgi:magnesium-protoporphyrin O-methyltransferase